MPLYASFKLALKEGAYSLWVSLMVAATDGAPIISAATVKRAATYSPIVVSPPRAR
jgi:hypothetical protein